MIDVLHQMRVIGRLGYQIKRGYSTITDIITAFRADRISRLTSYALLWEIVGR